MKRIYNYMLLAIMALATAGCADEINKDFPSAESGDEVQFGLSLPGLTRTIYGEKSGSAYPIYWVNGDKVQIISPNCLAGRNNAEYKVSVSSATQNYATSLTPTGDYGVQWGDQAAVFYSVYPSGEYTISDDGSTIKNLKINFSDDFEVIEGIVTPKQADCLMFAKTDEKAVGETVNLTYSPIATAVMFTLNGPGDNDKSANHEHTIQSIKLIAPEGTNIAGNFDVNLATSGNNQGKYVWTNWVEGGEKSNVITAQLFDKTTGEFHKIGKGEKIKMSMFLAPLESLEITNDWKIEILVQTDIVVKDEQGNDETQTVNKTFRKSLGMKNEDGTAVGTTLKPGMVHELPALPNLDVSSGTEWEVGNWMENIPRNVYLSEVSIPGTWNSLNPDFQGSAPSIAKQYGNGVRAFHLDTRWSTTASAGNSLLDPFYLLRDLTSDNMYLSVADGNTGRDVRESAGLGSIGASESLGQIMDGGNTSFANYLSQITNSVQPDEYMVVICTFAQNSYNGNKCPSTWYKAISDACAANTNVLDASKLTQNTLVGDVLNKVIVIVNMSEPITSTSELPAKSKCLFTYMPMLLTADLFNGTDDNKDDIWISADLVNKSGLIMYNSQAQISSDGETGYDKGDRGYAPSIAERTTILNKIVDWSKENYGDEDYAHNQWIYMGLGGYQMSQYGTAAVANSYLNIETTYNTWIYDIVTAMGPKEDGTTPIPYYPVGIVLMNNVNGTNNYTNKQYGFDEVVKEILLLNNKYRLQYDPNKPSDYNPNATPQSAAASYSSGMNDSNVAAFGWD